MKTENQIYIECLENDGVLYHEDGYKLVFKDEAFIITDGFLIIEGNDINPDGWSKTEPIEKFDVVWVEHENCVTQVVVTDNSHFIIGDMHLGSIVKAVNITKCKPSEIHPTIAAFRERCIKEFKG